MFPTIDTWRAQERPELEALYAELETLCLAEDAEAKESLAAVSERLGIEIQPSQLKERVIHIRVADDWIELSRDPELAEFNRDRFARWRSEIAQDTADDVLETDAHVMHMHLKRLHGDRLKSLLINSMPRLSAFAMLDEVLVDKLTLHLMRPTIERLSGETAATCDVQAALLEKILASLAYRGALEHCTFRGNEIVINKTIDGVRFTESYIVFSREMPISLSQSIKPGPLQDVIEIGEGPVDGLMIERASVNEDRYRKAMTNISLTTNRFDDDQIATLNPSRFLADDIAA